MELADDMKVKGEVMMSPFTDAASREQINADVPEFTAMACSDPIKEANSLSNSSHITSHGLGQPLKFFQ